MRHFTDGGRWALGVGSTARMASGPARHSKSGEDATIDRSIRSMGRSLWRTATRWPPGQRRSRIKAWPCVACTARHPSAPRPTGRRPPHPRSGRPSGRPAMGADGEDVTASVRRLGVHGRSLALVSYDGRLGPIAHRPPGRPFRAHRSAHTRALQTPLVAPVLLHRTW